MTNKTEEKNVDPNATAVWPVILWSTVGLVCAIIGFYTLYPLLMDKVSPVPAWLQWMGAVGYLAVMLQAAFKLGNRTL